MLRNDLTTYRRSGEPELYEALARRDPLALAEACSRTLPVAYAVGRRYLPSTDLDALLHSLYDQLWNDPPRDVPLERWVRSRCSGLALAELRSSGSAPASPSVRTIAPDLPDPSLPYLDTTERTLGSLDEPARRALLQAHDEGVPSGEQDAPDAAQSLVRALRALADPEGGDEAEADVEADGRLADWVFGLLPSDEAAALEREISGDPVRTSRTQVLRRGRRRIEGLPPTPDLGPRLIAAVLGGSAQEATPSTDQAAAGGTETGPEPAASSLTPPASVVDERPDDELLDTEWQPPDTGEDEGPAFDDTPPRGLPVADSALDTDPTAEEQGLRMSDLFDDAEEAEEAELAELAELAEDGAFAEDASGDATAAAARGEQPVEPQHDDASAEERFDDQGYADDDPFAELRDIDDMHEAPAYESDPDLEDPRFEDAEADEAAGPSAGKRILQVIGLLLLLAAAVGIGLLIGQFGVTTLQG